MLEKAQHKSKGSVYPEKGNTVGTVFFFHSFTLIRLYMGTAAALKADNYPLGYARHGVTRSCHSTSFYAETVTADRGDEFHALTVSVDFTAAHIKAFSLGESTELSSFNCLTVKINDKLQIILSARKGSEKPDKGYSYNGDDYEKVTLFKCFCELFISTQNQYHPLR